MELQKGILSQNLTLTHTIIQPLNSNPKPDMPHNMQPQLRLQGDQCTDGGLATATSWDLTLTLGMARFLP